jgi:hypothetical protein
MFSGGAFIHVYRVKPLTADVAFTYLGSKQEFTHADRSNVHLKTLLHSFEQFAKEKPSKKIKSIQNQRTFRPPVPGRAVMLLLKRCQEQMSGKSLCQTRLWQGDDY